MLPEMVRDKHISKDGTRYLITIYPKGNVWDIQYLESFTKQLQEITPRFAGTPPIFYILIKIFGEDGKRATLVTLIVVILLLWLDFRSIRKALIAIVPLLIGMLWMLGIMGLTGMKISILNIAAIPLIIGIGIDYGVHVLHRYEIEDNDRIYRVYASTGRAIVITSMTTMMGFGSMIFASFRGFGHLGSALFIGVATCMIAALFIMPILLRR